jgi:hypothetical protein
MSRKKQPKQVIEGIQANTVTAEVLAVGRGAQASKYSAGNAQDLAKAIENLRAGLEGLNLQPQAKEAIKEDLGELHAAAEGKQPQSDRAGRALQNLSGKLKMVGVVLSEVVSLSEPIRQIAGLLHIPLHILGL